MFLIQIRSRDTVSDVLAQSLVHSHAESSCLGGAWRQLEDQDREKQTTEPDKRGEEHDAVEHALELLQLLKDDIGSTLLHCVFVQLFERGVVSRILTID